jgi:hypothetical protein
MALKAGMAYGVVNHSGFGMHLCMKEHTNGLEIEAGIISFKTWDLPFTFKGKIKKLQN